MVVKHVNGPFFMLTCPTSNMDSVTSVTVVTSAVAVIPVTHLLGDLRLPDSPWAL